MLTHGLCIEDPAAAIATGYLMGYESSWSLTGISIPVQNNDLECLWCKLWQAATDYGCLIPAQVCLNSDKYATKSLETISVVHFIFRFAVISSHLPTSWIRGCGAHIVICQHTLCWAIESVFHLVCAITWIYTRSVCEGYCYNISNSQLCVNYPLEDGCPVQGNQKYTYLAT
jgi:hypothetical protein